MLSLLVVGLCVQSLKANDEDDVPNTFDKYFEGLTTETIEFPIYKMYRWRNHPTLFTTRPPPTRRIHITRPTTATTTEEPDDGEGDFKIIPFAKSMDAVNPFLDKDGKRGRKID